MRYVTKEKLADYPSLEGLDEAEVSGTLTDAGDLLAYVDGNPFVEDADLRAWASRRDMDVDRTNRALAFLGETRQVATVQAAAVVPRAATTERVAFEDMTVEWLQGIAGALGVDGRSSMAKAALITAIRKVMAAHRARPGRTVVEEAAEDTMRVATGMVPADQRSDASSRRAAG